MAIAPPQDRTELGKIKGGHTREHSSAFGVVSNVPAVHDRSAPWVGAGRDAPEAVAAHHEREAAKLKANMPKSAGGTGTIVPASKRTGQNASNAAGRGRGK
jgi:hypothetical protein